MRGEIYSMSGALPTLAGAGSGFVYVVARSSAGPLKVGIATNARRRIFDLENMNGHRFPLIWLSEPSARYQTIETEIHECMRPIRLLGEWFDTPFDFAVRLAQDVCAGRQRSRTRFSRAS